MSQKRTGSNEDTQAADHAGVRERHTRLTPEQLESLVHSLEGIVWEADPGSLRFHWVSREAERLLGYPVARWLNEPHFWIEHLHPEDREWAVAFCINATRRREDHEFDYRMIAADGRTVWLHDVVTYVAEPGRPDVLRGIMVDVTEKKRTEERIDLMERRLQRQKDVLVRLARRGELARGDFDGFARQVTEIAVRTLGVERVSVWFFNDERTILRCHTLFERTAQRHSNGLELSASNYPRYFAALQRNRVLVAHEAPREPDTSELAEGYLVPLGISSMLDAPLRRRGELIGVVCHEHVGAARRWEPDEQDFAGSIADFLALALEAGERLAAEEAARVAREDLLRQQRREHKRVEEELAKVRADLVRQTRLATIGQVAASIAHELRNPLGTIRNAAYYLRRHVPVGEPKWAEHLSIIRQEVQTADRIISNLLELSRAKAPSKERVDLGHAVRDAFLNVDGAGDLGLDLALDPDPFFVFADPDQLRQVLSNLVTNSVQAMRAPGRVFVRAREEEDGSSVIDVADDGPGVPPELRERVFEALFTTRTKGTGLGLSISRQIIERHGGSLELLETREPGAIFRIRLPVAHPE